ncbi:hypothetical protein CRENBAI_012073 [Crenichthys baileyi]|uniref:Uncharacterized protein n=1 Tax=Crenichthys baileyi TaxID=28760 RepID=A0AAV9SPY7_9TELE
MEFKVLGSFSGKAFDLVVLPRHGTHTQGRSAVKHWLLFSSMERDECDEEEDEEEYRGERRSHARSALNCGDGTSWVRGGRERERERVKLSARLFVHPLH